MMATPLDDLFPPSPRVLYAKAPLVQVVCQLTFPRLLAIETQAPVAFQERVRHGYPLFERGTAMMLPGLQAIPSEIAQIIGSQLGTQSYNFLTDDRTNVVAIAPDSLTLTCNRYTDWGTFTALLEPPVEALNDIYAPSFFSRIGLRYIDALNRDAIGLEGRPWSDLLNPDLLDRLAFPRFEQSVEVLNHQLQIALPDGSGTMTLRHGYGVVAGHPGNSYLIDFDFFRLSKTEVTDVRQTIDHFHQLSGRAFRWCIRDELHQALQPQPLE
jgi:uncharacterized protein (TIGR04255 family)